MEHSLRQSYKLAESGQTDEALACLDAALEASRPCDRDLRFARKVASARATILADAERYVDAERACEAWAQLGFANPFERWQHGLEAARTLDALGRPRDALAVLEDALSYRERHMLLAEEALVALAELSEKLGQPVDPKWRSFAELVAVTYGVEMPVQESLSQVLLTLAAKIEGMLPKHVNDGGDPPP